MARWWTRRTQSRIIEATAASGNQSIEEHEFDCELSLGCLYHVAPFLLSLSDDLSLSLALPSGQHLFGASDVSLAFSPSFTHCAPDAAAVTGHRSKPEDCASSEHTHPKPHDQSVRTIKLTNPFEQNCCCCCCCCSVSPWRTFYHRPSITYDHFVPFYLYRFQSFLGSLLELFTF